MILVLDLVLVLVMVMVMVLVRILVRDDIGTWVICGIVGGGGDLTRYGGVSWQVGLVEK